MAETLVISLDGMHASDVARIRKALNYSLESVEMRMRYRQLKAQGVGGRDERIARLATEYTMSEDTVSMRLWPRG